MIEFQLRVSKAVTIWSEIAVREKSRGGRAQRGDGRREPHVHSSTRRHPAARGHVAGHDRRPRPRQRRLHLSRRPRIAQRQHDDRLFRGGDLFGRSDDRDLRVLVVSDAALAPRPRPHRPGPDVFRHAARFGDDHRDARLAQRQRAGRRGRARAAPCEHVAELQPRPRPGAPLRAFGAGPPSRHPDGVGAFQPARRWREDRHANRDLRFRHGRAAPDPNVEPARRAVADRRPVERSGEGAVRARRKAPGQDARAGLEPRPGRPAQRRLRHRGDGSARDHRLAAADFGRFLRPADRRRSRRGLHRAGRRRPQRRSRGAPDRCRDQGAGGGRSAIESALGCRRQDCRRQTARAHAFRAALIR